MFLFFFSSLSFVVFAHWGFCLLLFTLSFFFFFCKPSLSFRSRFSLFFFFLYTLMVRDDVSFAEGLDNSCVCLDVGMSSLAAFLLPFLLRVCVTTMTNFFVRGEHVFFFLYVCRRCCCCRFPPALCFLCFPKRFTFFFSVAFEENCTCRWW